MRNLVLVSALLLAIGAASSAGCAPRATVGPPPPSTRTWKVSTRLEVRGEYDANPFLLTTGRKDALAAPSAADVASRRYLGMDAATDLITTARAAVSFEHSGAGGRPFVITPEVAYEFYATNAERRNVAIDLTLEQALQRDGRLRLRTAVQPSYFSRNYLADAVDADVNGSISAAERVYQRGDYSEVGAQVDYRRRLAKSSGSHPFGAFLSIGAGFIDRTYDAPFTARNYSGPTVTARLQLAPRKGLEFETSYELALLDSPLATQVILLDEPVFGQDLNGNGNATDRNARALRTVDRSRSEHVIGEVIRFGVGRRTSVELEAEYRFRTFTSEQAYDVANNGRKDQRLRLGADVAHRLGRRLRLLTGVRYGTQRLNRRTDLGADGAVDDYTRMRAHLGLRLAR